MDKFIDMLKRCLFSMRPSNLTIIVCPCSSIRKRKEVGWMIPKQVTLNVYLACRALNPLLTINIQGVQRIYPRVYYRIYKGMNHIKRDLSIIQRKLGRL